MKLSGEKNVVEAPFDYTPAGRSAQDDNPVNFVLTSHNLLAADSSYETWSDFIFLSRTKYLPVTTSASGDEAR